MQLLALQALHLQEASTTQRPVAPNAECVPLPPMAWTQSDGLLPSGYEGCRPFEEPNSTFEDEFLPEAEGPVQHEVSRKEQLETLVKGKTTLMISNIPCRISQTKVMEAVNRLGFGGKYDFLYVPTGGRTGRSRSVNLGYGFINFTRSSDCFRFALRFDGYRFQGTSGQRPCTIRLAETQGLFGNIRRLSRTLACNPLGHREISPIIFLAGGRQVSFAEVAAALDHNRSPR